MLDFGSSFFNDMVNQAMISFKTGSEFGVFFENIWSFQQKDVVYEFIIGGSVYVHRFLSKPYELQALLVLNTSKADFKRHIIQMFIQ